jgi:hypothetical protein
MWVKVFNPSHSGPALNDSVDAEVGEDALPSEPEARRFRAGPGTTYRVATVECLCRLDTEGHDAGPSILAHNEEVLCAQVDRLDR